MPTFGRTSSFQSDRVLLKIVFRKQAVTELDLSYNSPTDLNVKSTDMFSLLWNACSQKHRHFLNSFVVTRLQLGNAQQENAQRGKCSRHWRAAVERKKLNCSFSFPTRAVIFNSKRDTDFKRRYLARRRCREIVFIFWEMCWNWKAVENNKCCDGERRNPRSHRRVGSAHPKDSEVEGYLPRGTAFPRPDAAGRRFRMSRAG